MVTQNSIVAASNGLQGAMSRENPRYRSAQRATRDVGAWAPYAVELGIVALAVLLLPLVAAAQESGAPPMVTDRPDATESAVTVPAGMFQLESGYTFSSAAGGDVHDLGEILLRVGVLDFLELRVGVHSYRWVRAPLGTDQGLQDSSLGVKLKLLDGGGIGFGAPQVAVLASTTLPTGSSAASQDRLQPELRLSVAWDLSERVALGSNVLYAYTIDELDDDRFHQSGATLSVGYALSDRWGAYAEYFGAYTVLQDGPGEHFLNGGFTFAVSADLQLDARAGYGLNGRDDDFFVGFGSGVRW
jgi:hypothetical protein